MRQVVVGVGDGNVSRDPDTVLVTYALGSCVAVMLHDPEAGVAGMLHYMLPEPPPNKADSAARPWMYANTGITLLLQAVERHGAQRRRLVIYAAGGAQIMNDNSLFNIGKRNCLALRKVLWKLGLVPNAEEIGGTAARTVRMEVQSGRVWLHSPGGESREMRSRGVARPAQISEPA